MSRLLTPYRYRDLPLKACDIRFMCLNTLIVATDAGLETIELEARFYMNVADWSNKYYELSRRWHRTIELFQHDQETMKAEKKKIESDLEQEKSVRIAKEKETVERIRKLTEEHKNVLERQQQDFKRSLNQLRAESIATKQALKEKDKRIKHLANELSEANRYSQDLKTNIRGQNRKLGEMRQEIVEERRNHKAAVDTLQNAILDSAHQFRRSDREIKELEIALGKQLALNMKQQEDINKSLRNASNDSAEWEKKYRRLLLKVARPGTDGQIATEMLEEFALNSGKNDDLQNDTCASEEKKQSKSDADACGSIARSKRDSYEKRSQTDREKGLPPKKNGNGKKNAKAIRT